MKSKSVDGFDYILGTKVKKTVEEWKSAMAAVIAAGGFRRTESGETFGHGKDSTIVFEVYAIIPK